MWNDFISSGKVRNVVTRMETPAANPSVNFRQQIEAILRCSQDTTSRERDTKGQGETELSQEQVAEESQGQER